jgi:siroheme synthase (precorrin-2 oxidase/ferrochelatase)
MSLLVNLVLEGRPTLVVGVGVIAALRGRDLLAGGARVVAPANGSQVDDLAPARAVALVRRRCETDGLRETLVVVAVTNDEGLNASV